jgi:protoporphyrin/coproporphyrin ferrochelatase
VKTGIILLNFGEPETPTPEAVVPFLERIFTTNASLEGNPTADEIRARSRFLAEQRAPGLIEEYQEIGGSPLNRQATAQAAALRAELERRGHDVATYVAYQFAEPLIPDVVRRARQDGIQRLIGLPIYPLCGPSTTVAALEELHRAVVEQGWAIEPGEITGWHRHPEYIAMWADQVQALVAEHGLDLDGDARLVFSAHGTPMKYIEEGSRYDLYVKESCAQIAAAVGGPPYVIGYQNHTNRPVRWTQPDIDKAIAGLGARAIVVLPVSFMHEQSETLAELDVELREEAEELGLAFHRVPVPHDDPRFARLLADMVEALLSSGVPALAGAAGEGGDTGGGVGETEAEAEAGAGAGVGAARGETPVVAGVPLRQCVCRPVRNARCLNGG